MLRSFRMSNHRSVRDEQELVLISAYDKRRPAVSVAGIYGANAAGKSNVLDGLRFMRSAVVGSYRRWEPDAGVPRQGFKLDSKCSSAPSLFVVEIMLDHLWTYGFEVDDQRILSEWLYTYPRGRKRIVFERELDSIKFGSTLNENREILNFVHNLVRPNALFLSVSAQVGFDDALSVYRWFSRNLQIQRGGAAASRSSIVRLVERITTASDLRREEMLGLISAADFGIAGFEVEGEMIQQRLPGLDVPSMDTPPRPQPTTREVVEARRKLRFIHEGSDEPFAFSEESHGTQQWIAQLPSALDAVEWGGTLVVDELDASLHPRLVARLVELFKDDRVNTTGGQLIFTTHDATLLGTSLGEPILARDEVWFVEKDSSGASTLFPLSDFHPRIGENTERRYLGGSYGAVPAVFSDTLVERFLESRPGQQ